MVGFRVFDVGLLIVWLIWFFRLRDDDDDSHGDDGGGGEGPEPRPGQGRPGRRRHPAAAGPLGPRPRPRPLPRRPAAPPGAAGPSHRCASAAASRVQPATLAGADAPQLGPAPSRSAPGLSLQNSSKRSAGLSAGGGVSFSGVSAGGRAPVRRGAAVVRVGGGWSRSRWAASPSRSSGRAARRSRGPSARAPWARWSAARLVVSAAAGATATASDEQEQRAEARGQRSTAGSRRPQCGQSFRSFWTSCSSEQPHSRRFSTA